MKNRFAAASLLLALSTANYAQDVSSSSRENAKVKNVVNVSETKFLPLSDVKAGMRGTARTVFSGSESEEFEVEILGVMPGFIGPKHPAIIGRLSGKNAERTGVFAGMSGSPVFIDGKLVGAISFSFPFSKEPIAGITPIETMIEIFERKNVIKTQTEPRAVSFAQLTALDLQPTLPKQPIASSPFMAAIAPDSPLVKLLGQQFAPIATPLVFSGMNQETLNQFSTQLIANGVLPVSSVGGSAELKSLKKSTDKTLLPGDSVTVALARGDYSLAAAGTVTYRDGDKIYAFGHPFLNLGVTEMPMLESSVVIVIPNANNSFKLSVPGDMVGTLGQDRSTGIYGELGKTPKMIPVKINVKTSNNAAQIYDFEIVKDPFLTPLLLNMTVFNSITATERAIGDSTIVISGKINVKNAPPILLERKISASNAPVFAASSVATPTSLLLSSGFENIELSGIEINVTSTDTKNEATLQSLTIDKTQVKAGETFEMSASIRNDSGKSSVQKIPITLPKETAAGTYLVYIGDGNSLNQVSATRSFVPKNVSDLVNIINQVKKSDRLYAQVSRVSNGAVIGTSEMPNLPPSMLATLNNERTVGGVTPTILSPIYEQVIAPSESVITGQQVLTIEVIR
ncbi:MAG: hypothetical protein H7Z37_07995 [Pyrinomonadaceae bacterium]|nr:hypothetical protein [Pyrinomonadaceae bacterium]